jgi:hypothetical protein
MDSLAIGRIEVFTNSGSIEKNIGVNKLFDLKE